jgi:hypothetical protein
MSAEQRAALPAPYAIDVANMQYLFCSSVHGFTGDGWRRLQENRGSYWRRCFQSTLVGKQYLHCMQVKVGIKIMINPLLRTPKALRATELLLRLLLAVTVAGQRGCDRKQTEPQISMCDNIHTATAADDVSRYRAWQRGMQVQVQGQGACGEMRIKAGVVNGTNRRNELAVYTGPSG